jgi:hypothetical protein
MPRYGCTITVDTGEMPSTQTNFNWKAVTANFPTNAINGGASSILDGGGNLKCYTNSGKGTRLPLEVGKFVTGGSPDIIIWGTSASLGVGDTVYIEADTVATSLPADGAAFGRDAVWSARLAVHNMSNGGTGVTDEFADSTGNGYDGTGVGGTTSLDSDGFLVMSETQYVDFNVGLPMTSSDGIYFSLFFKRTTAEDGMIYASYTYPDYGGFAVRCQANGDLTFIVGDGSHPGPQGNRNVDFTAGIAVGDTALVSFTWPTNGSAFSDFKAYLDGQALSQNSTGGTVSFSDIPSKGSAGDGSIKGPAGYGAGAAVIAVKQAIFGLTEESADYIESTANVETSTATFWTTSAWIDQDGGGGTTTPLTLTYSAVAASSIAKSLDLSLALSYAGTGTATTDTASTFNLTKSYTATGTSAIAKLIQKTLAYLGIGTNSIAKEVAVTKEYSATGTAEQEESLVTEIAFSYTASALLTLAAQFILKPIVTAGKGYSIAGVYTAFKGYKVKAGYLYETVFKPTE